MAARAVHTTCTQRVGFPLYRELVPHGAHRTYRMGQRALVRGPWSRREGVDLIGALEGSAKAPSRADGVLVWGSWNVWGGSQPHGARGSS